MFDAMVARAQHWFEENVPEEVQGTLMLKAFGFTKVPMLFFAQPSVVELNDRACTVKIKLTWRTKNHYGSMYFGALAVGADSAAGLAAMYFVRKSGHSIKLLFKDVQGTFLKRANGDVLFRCDDTEAIQAAVERAATSGERVNVSVRVAALVPSVSATDVAAQFTMTLSLKRS